MSTMSKRPNILFIMSDDHAAKAISCYGAGINSTPNLDRIANEGMRFDHCYVTNSICTPSRATILTGTHNHVNGVLTLSSKINSSLPNVAKQLRSYGGYQTAMIGKWHLGEGKEHEPTGFDYWEVIPGQGEYFDPRFVNPKGTHRERGYVTEVITDKTIDFIEKRDKSRPFFVMCHHKAPHRSWECHPKHRELYKDEIRIPDNYDDDYKNRAKAAGAAKMRVEDDITYFDLGLAQPDGGAEEVGELSADWVDVRKIPMPSDENVHKLRLIDRQTGEIFTFQTRAELSHWKYQRYMQRYLRTIQSIDENVGRVLEYLDQEGLAENTMVIYTSDQGFFLGEHGWFDKRFVYEESFQMPFLVRAPGIPAGVVSKDIVSNVDFAPTFLEFADLHRPSYMQGSSFWNSCRGEGPKQSPDAVAYHRYWMHNDAMHHAYAHYGIRDARYKLIFWYNTSYGIEGTGSDGQQQEWELFDCEKDPMELFNIWADVKIEEIRERMVRLLERKLEEIGDRPSHPLGLSGVELVKRYEGSSGVAAGAAEQQHNMH